MADHLLGNQNYVINSGKLESSSVTWRIIIPYGSRNDWTNLRKSVGANKSRIEYRLIEDPKDIKLGVVLNETLAGVVFRTAWEGSTSTADSAALTLYFASGARICLFFHWNKAGRTVLL